MFRVVAIIFGLLGFICPQTALAAEDPTMDVSIPQFIVAYNIAAGALNTSGLPAEPSKRQSGPAATVATYTANKYAAVQIHYPPKNDRPKLILFFGAGDGTEQSGFQMILGAISFVGALTPKMDGDSRGAVLKQLGLMPLAITDGRQRTWRGQGMEMISQYNTSTGLMVGAGPAATR